MGWVGQVSKDLCGWGGILKHQLQLLDETVCSRERQLVHSSLKCSCTKAITGSYIAGKNKLF